MHCPVRAELERKVSDSIQVLVALQVRYPDASPAVSPSPEIEAAREIFEARLQQVIEHIREHGCKEL